VVSGAKPRGEIGDGGLGSEAPIDQFQQPGAPGIGVAMLLQTQQEAEAGGSIDPHQDGISRQEDLIEEADVDGGEVVLVVDFLGLSNGAVHDVVHAPQGDPKGAGEGQPGPMPRVEVKSDCESDKCEIA
jgi:hypothetical protein